MAIRNTAVGIVREIPHHAGAILMCESASIQDPKLQSLCKSIIRGQQAEIDQMKAKLRQLQK